jgi:hypothetical protein
VGFEGRLFVCTASDVGTCALFAPRGGDHAGRSAVTATDDRTGRGVNYGRQHRRSAGRCRGRGTIKEGVTEGAFLTRDLGGSRNPIDLPTKSELEWALKDHAYDVAPWDSTVTRGFRNKLEGWGTGRGSASWRNHNRVHRWVGGAMLGGASVNDPVFLLHHAFIDLQVEPLAAPAPRGPLSPRDTAGPRRRAARPHRGTAPEAAAVGHDPGRTTGRRPDLPARVR